MILCWCPDWLNWWRRSSYIILALGYGLQIFNYPFYYSPKSIVLNFCILIFKHHCHVFIITTYFKSYFNTLIFLRITMEDPSSFVRTIEWDMMDKTKFFPLSMLSSFCVRASLYPLTLIKTRLQVQKHGQMYSG